MLVVCQSRVEAWSCRPPDERNLSHLSCSCESTLPATCLLGAHMRWAPSCCRGSMKQPIDVVPSTIAVSDAAPALSQFIGVAARVMARMRQVAAGEGPHRRPILLFPEGTTTNGQYLLGFRTGSFIAGVPVQPIILKYGRVRSEQRYVTGRTQADALRAVVGGQSQTSRESARHKTECRVRRSPEVVRWQAYLWPLAGLCWQVCVSVFDADHRPPQSRVSPAWETIGGAWHIFLMLANPLHTVTVYEVTTAEWTALISGLHCGIDLHQTSAGPPSVVCC